MQGQPAAPSVPPLRYCCDKLFVITNDGGLLVGHLDSSYSRSPSPSGVYPGGHFWEHRFMLPLILWSLSSLCCWDSILVCAFSTKIYLLEYLLEEASFILGSFPSYLFMFPLLFCFSGPINLGLISTWRNRFNGSFRDYSSQDWSTAYSQMAEVLNLNSPPGRSKCCIRPSHGAMGDWFNYQTLSHEKDIFIFFNLVWWKEVEGCIIWTAFLIYCRNRTLSSSITSQSPLDYEIVAITLINVG